MKPTIVTDDEELVAGGGGNFAPLPLPREKRPHQAVLVDIRDLGMVESEYNGEKKTNPTLLFTWQLKGTMKIIDPETGEPDEKNKFNGQRFQVSKRYTNSFADQASLRKLIPTLIGRKLTKEEIAKPKTFNLASNLLGTNCYITVKHSEDEKYANVDTILPYDDEDDEDGNPAPARLKPKNFTRWKDRPKDADGNVIKGGKQTEARGAQADEEALEADEAALRSEYRTLLAKAKSEELEQFEDWNAKQTPIEKIPARIEKLRVALKKSISERAKAQEDDDEDDEKPKKKSKPAPVEDDEEEEAPKKKKKVQEPEDDDEDEPEPPKAKKKPAPVEDDEDDDEPAPVKKKAKTQVQEDEDDEPKKFSLVEIAKKYKKLFGQDMPNHIANVFKTAHDADIDLGTDPVGGAFVGKVNAFMESTGRSPIATISDLRPAPAALVAKAMEDEKFLVGKKSKPAKDEDEDDEEDAPKPKAKKKPAPVEDDEDDDEDEPKPKKKAKPAQDDDEDEDEAPKPKKKAKAPVEDDDDEEEEPRPKKKKRVVEDDDD